MMKLLLALVQKIMGETRGPDGMRADMCLPERLLAMAIVMFIVAVAAVAGAVISGNFTFFAAAAVLAAIGIAMVLCWKNQKIKMLDDDRFEYTTMLGSSKVYRFDQIEGVRQNRDSNTLYVAGDKVHIEAMAMMTQRLADRINEELSKKMTSE